METLHLCLTLEQAEQFAPVLQAQGTLKQAGIFAVVGFGSIRVYRRTSGGFTLPVKPPVQPQRTKMQPSQLEEKVDRFPFPKLKGPAQNNGRGKYNFYKPIGRIPGPSQPLTQKSI
jgi:hypothetical protein